jgi:hypothetical protein
MSSLPEYKVWTGIIKRCTNPKCKSWRNYGGAGVTVCDRWRNSFEAFYADMGPRPGKDYDLDKDILIPGNKVYGPHACQWLKRSEHRSLSNKGSRRNRGARVALVDGIEMTCNQIAAKYGLRIATVWLRMKNGRTGADLIAPPDSTRKVVVKHLAA